MKILFYFISFCSLALSIGCSSRPSSSTKSGAEDLSMQVFLAPKSDSVENPLSKIMLIEAGQQKFLGNYEQATHFYNQALISDSLNDAAYYELADIYTSEESNLINSDLALEYSKKAYEIDPENEVYQLQYARLLIDKKQYDKGISLLNQLVEKNPHNKKYVFDLAFAYEQAEQIDSAISLYEDLERQYGFDPEISYQKHVLYFQNGMIEEGIDEVKKLVEQHPENTNYLIFLANHYYHEKDFEQTEHYAKEAIKNGSTDTKAYVFLLQSQLKQNKGEELLATLNQLVISDLDLNQKIQIFFPLIDVISENPEWSDEILEVANHLIQEYPNDAKPYALYGDLLFTSGRDQEAIKAFNHSKSLDPTNYSVWEQMIFYYLDQDDFHSLSKLSRDASDQFPKKVFPAYISGYSYFKIKNYVQATIMLERALNIEDIDLDLKIQSHAILGDSYYQLKNYDQAFHNYDQVLLLDPDNEYVLNNYSYYLATQNNKLGKAEEMARRAAQLNPSDFNTMDTFGYVLYKNGRYEEAVSILSEAANMIDDSAIVFEHYGDALYQAGERNKALVQWKKALEIDPDNLGLQKKVSTGLMDKP